jgi:hypothetical protein
LRPVGTARFRRANVQDARLAKTPAWKPETGCRRLEGKPRHTAQ